MSGNRSGRKRKNGEGSWGKKITNGYTYFYFRNADGKYFYGKTEQEVKKKITASKSKSKGNTEEKKIQKQFFGDYVLAWLNEYKRMDVKESTADGYEDCIKGQLIDYPDYRLSDIQVGALTTDHFIEYYKSLADNYTKGTIDKNYSILAQCIKFGNKRKHFDIDLDEIHVPHKDQIKKETREIRILDDEDMEKLYHESKRINQQGYNFGGKIGQPTYGNAANLLIFIMVTGLRIGEAMDLRWQDLNLCSPNPSVHVTTTLVTVKNKDDNSDIKYEVRSSKPKTDAGDRVVPLCKVAMEIIDIESDLNPKHTPEDHVFLNKNGKPFTIRRNLNRTLTDMAVRGGLSVPDITPHELRHSFGSILIRKGADSQVVSKLLGHTDVGFTYRVYIHILEEQKFKAIESLDGFFADIF